MLLCSRGVDTGRPLWKNSHDMKPNLLTRRAFARLPFALVALASLPGAQAEPPPAAPILDCHVHLWDIARPAGLGWIKPDNRILYRSFLPKDHEPVAKANGVQGIIVVQAGQSLLDNQWNLDITAHNPALYRGVVGNLSEVIGTPQFEPLFETLCKDPRYVGFRLSGRYQKELTEAFFADLRLTARKGRAVDILLGGYRLEEVVEIARRVPELRILINHLGGVKLDGAPLAPGWVESFRAVAQQPNVHCKVSALFGRWEKQPAPRDLAAYTEVLDLAFACFGADRLVYGCDWPVSEQTADYAAVLQLTRAYVEPKGRAVVEKVFHHNAVAFYRPPQTVSGAGTPPGSP